MSRIGKMPVSIPEGVTATVAGDTLTVKGAKGELIVNINPAVKVKVAEGEIICDAPAEHSALHGLQRSLIANAVEGVTSGFEKRLEVVGVGFKLQKKGEGLELGLGFSHPVEVHPLAGVKLDIDPENKMTIIVSGIDKQQVGEQAARIRAIKKPEPYKGKGIKYTDERIHRKAGKTAGAK